MTGELWRCWPRGRRPFRARFRLGAMDTSVDIRITHPPTRGREPRATDRGAATRMAAEVAVRLRQILEQAAVAMALRANMAAAMVAALAEAQPELTTSASRSWVAAVAAASASANPEAA